MNNDIAIIIPSRIGSTRLPGKPLAKIGDKSLIEHVISCLKPKFKNNLYIATDSKRIAEVVELSGANAIMTDENCATGSDRIYQAYTKIPGNDKIKYIINVQGDMPFVNPATVEDVINRLKQGDCDIATPVVKIDKKEAISESNVKVVADKQNRAMYFSRSLIPHGSQEFLYHVGIYGFTTQALTKFVNLQEATYESCEKLEQLRALENGIKIGISIADDIPISVDTPEDLKKAIEYYNSKSQ